MVNSIGVPARIRLVPSPPKDSARRRANGKKIGRLQRGAADQAAVDVGLREQVRGVAGLDAAAIDDAGRVGDFSIGAGELATQQRVDLLGLFRAGGTAGADGPDRFV